jgi:hypothetical protein
MSPAPLELLLPPLEHSQKLRARPAPLERLALSQPQQLLLIVVLRDTSAWLELLALSPVE